MLVVVGILIVILDNILVVRMVLHVNLPIKCLSIKLSKFPPLWGFDQKIASLVMSVE